MAVEVASPKKQQNTSMGRRLLGMAAPVVGGIYGGAAGAAAGGMIGAKITGASTQDSVLAGAESGLSAQASSESKSKSLAKGLDNTKPAASITNGMSDLRGQSIQPVAESSYSRRLMSKTQDPQIAASEGLDILSQLPQSHPMRQQYTEPLVRMQVMSQRRGHAGRGNIA